MRCSAESSTCGRLRKTWSSYPCRPRPSTTWGRSRWAIVARSPPGGATRRELGCGVGCSSSRARWRRCTAPERPSGLPSISLCGPRASSSLLLELVDCEPQPEHRGVEVAPQLVVEGAGLRDVRHELERVADVLGRRFLGASLGAAEAPGFPATRAASTAVASGAPLGLPQGERLPALARAPLDPAPPIGGYAPVGEQALLAGEAGHAPICLAAGIPATSPRGQIWPVTRLLAFTILPGLPLGVVAQSPHAATPERPSVATHAYAVAPGYAELEQGVRAQGLGNLRDQTSWEFNLKIGVARALQLGLFGTGYNRTGQGNGVGDVGVALKLRRDLSSTHAVALVPAVTLPTGDGSLGLGAAGRDQL